MSDHGARFCTNAGVKRRVARNPLLRTVEPGRQRAFVHPYGAEHTYGKALKRDKEGAGEVLRWTEPAREVSTKHTAATDFMALNKLSVREGASACRDRAAFRATHRDVTLKTASRSKHRDTSKHLPSDRNAQHTYGQRVRYGENAKRLLTYEFEREWEEEAARRYEATVEQLQARAQKRQRPTAAKTTQKKDAAAEQHGSSASSKLDPAWKLHRFQGVASRFRETSKP